MLGVEPLLECRAAIERAGVGNCRRFVRCFVRQKTIEVTRLGSHLGRPCKRPELSYREQMSPQLVFQQGEDRENLYCVPLQDGS
jgi:hypothetical protein